MEEVWPYEETIVKGKTLGLTNSVLKLKIKSEPEPTADIDSGAGDSISDSSQSYNAKQIYLDQGSPRSIPSSRSYNTPLKTRRGLTTQPSFSTFKDEDAASVQIYDEQRYNTDFSRIFND